MTLFKNSIIVVLALFFAGSAELIAQDKKLRGQVLEKEAHHDHYHKVPLAGANVVWLGTTQGAATDQNGKFELEVGVELPHKLVVSYIGYQSDTIEISRAEQEIEVILATTRDLDEVVVTGRQVGAHYSTLEPVLTQKITSSEMQRAACCNLAEAFETSASVDVSYSDAVTGAQQIQMLGLAGIYSQIMVEYIPSIRGLAQPYGLSYIPGPWMESIQISKGAASVVNGY